MTAVESYGLKLAESVRFPPSIVPKAKLIYRDLKAREELENTVRHRFVSRPIVVHIHNFPHFRLFDEMVSANARSLQRG